MGASKGTSRVDTRPGRSLYFALFPQGTRSSGQVAQLVEHLTENQGVGGSIPSLATKIKIETGSPKAARFCFVCL